VGSRSTRTHVFVLGSQRSLTVDTRFSCDITEGDETDFSCRLNDGDVVAKVAVGSRHPAKRLPVEGLVETALA